MNHHQKRAQQAHLRRAQDLIDFVNEHGRTPSTYSEDVSERSLAYWRIKFKIAPDRAAAALLDAQLPNWAEHVRETTETRSRSRAQELVDFATEHGRMPRSGVEAEHDLRHWTDQFRRNSSNLEVFRSLDEAIPGWASVRNLRHLPRDVPPESTHTLRRAQELIDFYAQHRRMPLAKGAGERSLGQWRWRLRQRPVHPDLIERLDLFAPGWDEAHPRLQTAIDLVDFHLEHRRMPSAAAPDPDEVSLAKWVMRHRGSQESTVASRRLDRQLPQWRRTIGSRSAELNPEHNLNRAVALIGFYVRHGRMPSSVADRKEERSLAWWRRDHLVRGYPTEASRLLDEQLPGWRGNSHRIAQRIH